MSMPPPSVIGVFQDADREQQMRAGDSGLSLHLERTANQYWKAKIVLEDPATGDHNYIGGSQNPEQAIKRAMLAFLLANEKDFGLLGLED